jgi:hypothetical protein
MLPACVLRTPSDVLLRYNPRLAKIVLAMKKWSN